MMMLVRFLKSVNLLFKMLLPLLLPSPLVEVEELVLNTFPRYSAFLTTMLQGLYQLHLS